MHNRFLFFWSAALCWFIGIRSPTESRSEEPRSAKAEKRFTVTYDVADLVYKPGATKPGYASSENLIRTLLAAIAPESWRATRGNASTIRVFNDTKLEIHTTEAQHRRALLIGNAATATANFGGSAPNVSNTPNVLVTHRGMTAPGRGTLGAQ